MGDSTRPARISCLEVTAPLLHAVLSAHQVPASNCSACASPWAPWQAVSAQHPSVLPGAQPSVRQQQSCHINLSAPGEQCTGLFSIHLGLNAVSGSKTAAPPSLELRGQQRAPVQSTHPCMPWDQRVLIDWGWGEMAEGFALSSAHFSRDPSARKKSWAISCHFYPLAWEFHASGNDQFSTSWRRSVLLPKGPHFLTDLCCHQRYQFRRMTRLYGPKPSFHPLFSLESITRLLSLPLLEPKPVAEVLSSSKQARSCLFCSSGCKGDEGELLVQHSWRGSIYLACDDGALNTSEAGEETGAELESGLSVKYKRTLRLF